MGNVDSLLMKKHLIRTFITAVIILCTGVFGFLISKKFKKDKKISDHPQFLSAEQKKSAEQQLLEYNQRLESSPIIQMLKDNKTEELKAAVQNPKTMKDLEQTYQSALHYFQIQNKEIKFDQKILALFAELTTQFVEQNKTTSHGEKARALVLATRTLAALPDNAFPKGKVAVLMGILGQKSLEEQLGWILIDHLGSRDNLNPEIFNKLKSSVHSKNNITVVNAVSVIEKMHDEKQKQLILNDIYTYFSKANENIKPYLLRALITGKLNELEVESITKDIMKSNDEILYEVALDFINNKGITKTTTPLLERISKSINNPILKSRAQNLLNQVKKEKTL